MRCGRVNGEDGTVTTTAFSAEPSASLEAPRLYRRTRGRVLGGVAGGIADHLGVPVAAVRIAFVLLALGGGIGLPLYGVYWIVLPAVPGEPEESRVPRWLGYLLAAVLAAGTVFGLSRFMPLGALFVPSILAVFGAALIWRQAGETQRATWRRLSRTSLMADTEQRAGRMRVLAGVALVVIAAVAVLAHNDLFAAQDVLVAVVVAAVGVVLITGPWWMRMATELSDERRERIRSQERAEIAAHLHDSVLQTLALIQRNASSPREVARLARGQERELRTLLYGPRHASGQFAEALKSVSGEVEDDYAVTVDLVVVGDATIDEPLAAVAAASREALINAAKHSGVSEISVYAEIDEGTVTVYVRDRGRGFDVDAVAPDRHGVRDSIIGRVERYGGNVTVRTAPGSGTEFEISMVRTAST
jgi:signal transduction histidine kinase